MNYLTDTHTLIWSILDPGKLSSKAKFILENPKDTIFVSAINFWEVSLKFSIGKLELRDILPHDFPSLALEMGFQLIPMNPEEAASYHHLKGNFHKDPFDKMLIWQAIRHDFTLISRDINVIKYKGEGLKVVW